MSDASIGKEIILSGASGKYEPSNSAPDTGQFVEMRTGASNSEYFKPKKIPSPKELQDQEDQIIIDSGTTQFTQKLLEADKYSETLKLQPNGNLDYRKPGGDELTSLFAHLCGKSEILYKTLSVIGGQHPEWNIAVNEDREKQLLTYTVLKNKTTQR